MELASGWCVGLRHWFRGFDTQLGHLPRCIYFTYLKTQDAIMWLKIKKRYKNKLMKLNQWHGLHLLSTANTQHPSPGRLQKKRNLSFLKRTDFSSCGACRNCYHVFFCSVQLSNLTSRNFYYNAMQQYR